MVNLSIPSVYIVGIFGSAPSAHGSKNRKWVIACRTYNFGKIDPIKTIWSLARPTFRPKISIISAVLLKFFRVTNKPTTNRGTLSIALMGVLYLECHSGVQSVQILIKWQTSSAWRTASRNAATEKMIGKGSTFTIAVVFVPQLRSSASWFSNLISSSSSEHDDSVDFGDGESASSPPEVAAVASLTRSKMNGSSSGHVIAFRCRSSNSFRSLRRGPVWEPYSTVSATTF